MTEQEYQAKTLAMIHIRLAVVEAIKSGMDKDEITDVVNDTVFGIKYQGIDEVEKTERHSLQVSLAKKVASLLEIALRRELNAK